MRPRLAPIFPIVLGLALGACEDNTADEADQPAESGKAAPPSEGIAWRWNCTSEPIARHAFSLVLADPRYSSLLAMKPLALVVLLPWMSPRASALAAFHHPRTFRLPMPLTWRRGGAQAWIFAARRSTARRGRGYGRGTWHFAPLATKVVRWEFTISILADCAAMSTPMAQPIT